MVHDGCWSTVICTGGERAALGDTTDTGWVLGCRLSIGHRGDHATDAEAVPRFDRRLWLEWNDRDQHAQSLIDRNPCPAPGHCMLFDGHGGVHWYAPSNGHAPSVGGGRRHVGGPDTDGPGSTTTVDRDTAPAEFHSGDFPSGYLARTDPTDAALAGGDHPTGDIPNLRGRAVRTPPDVDAFRPEDDRAPMPSDFAGAGPDASGIESPWRGGSHRDDAPLDAVVDGRPRPDAVSDALDDVVAALSRLARALRADRSSGRPTS